MDALLETMRRLRAKDGCPWDRAQTHESLRKYLLEETAEVLEVLDRPTYALKDSDLEEELGDLLLQILLHAEIASERGAFSFSSLAEKLNRKLIERHPHVFEDKSAQNTSEAQALWDSRKPKKAQSILSGMPKGLPALEVSNIIQSRVAKFGFNWDSKEACFEKVREEYEELSEAFLAWDGKEDSFSQRHALREEAGDVLFILCSFLQMCGEQPEEVLRASNQKFIRRFRYIEILSLGQKINRDKMEALWLEAKTLEKKNVIAITGGIGSGKSKVLEYLKKQGFATLSADLIAKDIRDNDPATKAFLQTQFGTSDKAEIRAQCLQFPAKKLALESWLHPRIQAVALQRMSQLDKKMIAYEIPLLTETMQDATLSALLFSAIWVVEAPVGVRLKRIENRGLNAKEARAWMDVQATAEERAQLGTHFLKNDGLLTHLEQQIEALLKEIPALD